MNYNEPIYVKDSKGGGGYFSIDKISKLCTKYTFPIYKITN